MRVSRKILNHLFSWRLITLLYTFRVISTSYTDALTLSGCRKDTKGTLRGGRYYFDFLMNNNIKVIFVCLLAMDIIFLNWISKIFPFCLTMFSCWFMSFSYILHLSSFLEICIANMVYQSGIDFLPSCQFSFFFNKDYLKITLPFS